MGSYKSITACNSANRMNPAFHAEPLTSRVETSNEHIFNDTFWESLDFVTDAVDNIKAR